MASIRSGIVPESSETPPKAEDYVIVTSSSGEAHRMVRPCARHSAAAAATPAGSCGRHCCLLN